MNKPKNKLTTIVISCLIVAVAFTSCAKNGPIKKETGAPAEGTDLKIIKGDITETATFIPYTAGNIKMEIIAVKAPDGTIRTAMNTCQVCYDSGRGYYVQKGDTLVCQNCGNRFKISQVEKQKNGCNPVPILEENKQDDGSTITVSGSYLEQNKELFANWKTR